MSEVWSMHHILGMVIVYQYASQPQSVIKLQRMSEVVWGMHPSLGMDIFCREIAQMKEKKQIIALRAEVHWLGYP